MKRILILACALAVAAGCGGGKKRFTVVVDPPDAEILVIPDGNEVEQKLSSPAKVAVSLPSKRSLAARSRLEIKREKYKTKTLRIDMIDNGQEVQVKLEKIVHYLLTFKLTAPLPSDDLRYRDQVLAAGFNIQEKKFEATLRNHSQKPLKILWEQAMYTDHVNKQHRLMHSGIKPQDRNNPLPPQVIQPGESITLEIMPASMVTYSPEKKAYEGKPLFPVDSEIGQALKGRHVYLFLPIDMDRQIIPYNFKFQIADAVKDL